MGSSPRLRQASSYSCISVLRLSELVVSVVRGVCTVHEQLTVWWHWWWVMCGVCHQWWGQLGTVDMLFAVYSGARSGESGRLAPTHVIRHVSQCQPRDEDNDDDSHDNHNDGDAKADSKFDNNDARDSHLFDQRMTSHSPKCLEP